jgi:hypothetical protein
MRTVAAPPGRNQHGEGYNHTVKFGTDGFCFNAKAKDRCAPDLLDHAGGRAFAACHLSDQALLRIERDRKQSQFQGHQHSFPAHWEETQAVLGLPGVQRLDE